MQKFFEFKGKKLSYHADWVGQNLWVHVNGKTFLVEAQKESRRGRRKLEGAGHNKILAPMPGKVTKILVKDQQEVKKGQAVIVMEAMKMEYTLKAEMNGTVGKIAAKAGDQVSLGQVLVELKEKTA